MPSTKTKQMWLIDPRDRMLMLAGQGRGGLASGAAKTVFMLDSIVLKVAGLRGQGRDELNTWQHASKHDRDLAHRLCPILDHWEGVGKNRWDTSGREKVILTVQPRCVTLKEYVAQVGYDAYDLPLRRMLESVMPRHLRADYREAKAIWRDRGIEDTFSSNIGLLDGRWVCLDYGITSMGS